MEKIKLPLVVQIWDNQQKLIVDMGDLSILPTIFFEKIDSNYNHEGYRNIYRISDIGSIRLIVKVKDKYFQGTKEVSHICLVFLSLIPKFKQIENSQRQHFDSITRRFAHNLVKFQTRFKGNFSRLISDNARSRPFSEFLDEVKRRIESNTSAAAQDVCQMSHRAVDLDAQIDTLRVISGYVDATKPDTKIFVDLQKTVHRLTNPFVEELKKKNVSIRNNIPVAKSIAEKISLAPTLFNAAIWQLLDNASKYVMNGTDITISASLGKNKMMEIEMISVCIDDDELEKIFLEGYKGKKSGNKSVGGIGLFIVKKSLSLMNAKIYVKNNGFVTKMDDFEYCKHTFIIEFFNDHSRKVV